MAESTRISRTKRCIAIPMNFLLEQRYPVTIFLNIILSHVIEYAESFGGNNPEFWKYLKYSDLANYLCGFRIYDE